MRTALIFIWLLLLNCSISAQPLITNGEYFIDNDPGLGNGVPFSFAASQDVIQNLSIDVDTLSNNLHNLYLRVQDANGSWSLSSVHPFLKITPSNTDIVKAEYFFNSDPGLGNGTDIPIIADTNLTINTPVNIAALSSGLHIFYVRVKNGQGFWSMTEIRPVFKVENSNTPITDIEYFWNNDPGEGNATSVSFTSSNNVTVVFSPAYTSLPDGFHNFYVRVKNQNNFWSLTNSQPFYKLTDPTSDVSQIEYFWDTDPGEGFGTQVPFSADTNVTVVFPADLNNIADGFHNFYIRVRNTQGFWSLTSIRPVFKVSDANSNIAAMEYFIDSDPGFGNGTSIVLDSIVRDITQNTLIDLTGVPGGIHTLYVRAQNDDGLWSLTHNRPFFKTSGGADVVKIEYFFDSDPGHGNGFSIPLGSTQDTAWNGVIDLTAIPQGYHNLYVRTQSSDGSWSLTHTRRFAWCNGPQINIGTLTDTICLGATINVWDSTSNLDATTKYEWDWESDGLVDDTTLGPVSHTYLDTGTYFLTLVATSFDTCYDSTAFRVTVLPPPVANFVADTACRTFLTSFTDSSFTVLPTQYAWDFDNDFIGDSSTVGNVQHIFPSAGIFPVNLLLDMGYNCLDTFTADVEVKEQPVPLYIAPGNCLGELTTLNDVSTNVLPAAKYFWDVQPDGIIDDSTIGSISRIYPDTGLYFPQLIIDNQNGCIDTSSRGVKIHGLPLLNTIQTSPTCFGGFDGSATVNVLGDPGKYTYRWTDENNQNTQTAVGLYARRYLVSVVDSNGCFNRDTIDVVNPPKIDLVITSSNDATCGLSNGNATLAINSGVPPFELNWTNGDTTLFIDNLDAGIYIATVTDAQGCSNIIPALISNTNAPSVTINSVTDVTCFGDEDGAVNVNVTGGATPYTFDWSNGDTTEDISNLSPGPYEIFVYGSDGCLSIVQAIVGEPDKILVDVQGFESYCGLPAGAAQSSVIGGSGPISYLWSTGGTGPSISNLDAGVYTLNVTDTNNCTEVGYVAISDTGSATIFIDSLIDVTCGLVNGAMYIKVLKVRGLPQYLWENGDTTEDHINVDVGLHYVQVADSNNCKAFEFGVLDYIAPIPNPICMITTDTLDSVANTEAVFVVWEKLSNPAVESYNVYRESTQSGVYYRVGNVKKTDPGLFIDSTSDIRNRWWRYKITVLDSCGNESDINAVAASAHKTINLNSTINAARDSAFLIWDQYIGFQFTDYLIYRYDNFTNSYTWVDTVPSTQRKYIDTSFPQNADTIYYFVFAENAFECDPNKGEDYTKTRSNPSFASRIFIGMTDIDLNNKLKIYPNPAGEKVYIDYSENINEILVTNLNGVLIKKIKGFKPEKGISLKNLPSGVYFIKIETDDGLFVRKIIKD
ncbi:MAG: T9SS type A sorting domain-containing protein [Cytophagales bacterium]